MRVALLVLAGCNSVYGLDGTKLLEVDARAPFRCPTDGSPPAFSADLHQIIKRGCNTYTFSESANVALYGCFTQPTTIEEGKIDDAATFTPIELTATVPNSRITSPRISPDGERLFVRQIYDVDLSVETTYRREGNRWVDPVDIDADTYNETYGVPSALPDRRVIVIAGGELREYGELSDRTWKLLATYPSGSLLSAGHPLNLSPDGLSAIFQVNAGVRYTRRQSLSDPFTSAVDIPGIPAGVQTPFITSNCSRLYFSALGSIWYAVQL